MADNKKRPQIKREIIFDILYFIAVIVAVFSLRNVFAPQPAVKAISYSEFQQLVDKGDVTDIVVGQTTITGKFKTAPAGSPAGFSTIRVDPQIAGELASHNIAFSGKPAPGFFENLLEWLLPSAIFILIWFLLMRPMMTGRGGLMAVGRSRAKLYSEENVKVTFADVAGVDEAKDELSEVVGFLKNPQTASRLGARIPKGILLVGPPGTGKTLLARAVAGEAGVRFYSITGSEFVEMFVGVGAARVRDLFEQARAEAPAIVFIDELDALGRARGIDFPGAGHDEKEQTLNQLLAEMDGFDPSIGIVVLAATNRPEVLDPALLRAGRFDRQVLVDRPDRKGRAAILRVHLKSIRADENLDVEEIAAMTTGFTGADLANLVNEAALGATRRGANATTLEDFTQAIERIVGGIEKKSRILSPRERAVVAHHEIGHALVAMALPGSDKVQKVSIVPRGIGALGYTMQRPTEDRFLLARSELNDRMAVLLGGRAAESLVFGDISTGAADDLARATDIARNMVVRFGMTADLGQVAYETESGSFLVGRTPMWRPHNYGEATAEAIDHAVKLLIDDAFTTARDILERNRSILEAAAHELLARETLGPEDLAKLTAHLQGGRRHLPSSAAAQ